MKWEPCLLQSKTSTTTDALGNPVESYATVLSTKCRLSPFDDTKTSIDGRAVTSSEQYFIINKTSLQFCYIKYNNKEYEVLELIDYGPRWLVVRAKEYEVRN